MAVSCKWRHAVPGPQCARRQFHFTLAGGSNTEQRPCHSITVTHLPPHERRVARGVPDALARVAQQQHLQASMYACKCHSRQNTLARQQHLGRMPPTASLAYYLHSTSTAPAHSMHAQADQSMRQRSSLMQPARTARTARG